MTDEQAIWVEAATELFREVQHVPTQAEVERLAALVEEMASMDQVERRSYPDDFEGPTAEAMRAWIRDTDESDGEA